MIVASTTYSGVVREIPVVPFPVGQGSQLVRGNVVEWNNTLQEVRAWSSGVVQASVFAPERQTIDS
jgi:hypothetical protein